MRLDNTDSHETAALCDLEMAFRLAYFILPDRSAALQVTVQALTNLDDLLAEQDRRRFSRPKKFRTKVSKSRSQLLQHLVCCVALSQPVRQRREEESLSLADELLVRFLVELTRIATRRSSFYVNLAISRILHDYSTAETRAINDLLTQDPERMRNETYFRYGKGLLIKEMRHSFGPVLATSRQARGEIRFRAHRPSPWQARLVHECLRLLTPWETHCPLPESLDPLREELPTLCFAGGHPDDEHPVDMRRMHTVLHPRCYEKATRALGLEAPSQRLWIPELSPDATPGRRQKPATRRLAGRRPRPLSVEEKAQVAARLKTIAQRRRQWSLRRLDT